MDWLKQVAPTIATALGGPLAGLAVSAVSKAMGINEADVNETIKTGKLTAEQLASIKQAEIELQKSAQELGLNFEQLAVEDRKSAREMQVNTKSFIPATLAVVVTLGFFGILYMLMTGKIMPGSEALMIMLGSLGTAWTGIIAFYFGSSAGSQAKDAMMQKSASIK
jgi:hypothetical protein